MRTRLIRQGVAALLVMLTACAALAIDVSDSRFGSDTLIHDDTTGLTWLRFDETLGYSWEFVNQNLDQGGFFDGFSVASGTQVRSLFSPDRGFYSNAESPPPQAPTPGETSDMLELMGFVGGPSFAGGGTLTGATSDAALYCGGVLACQEIYAQQFFVSFPGPGGWGYAVDDSSFPVGPADPLAGTWLVSLVPEPSTSALMIAGLLMLSGQLARLRGARSLT
jgi:hypothetical protein